MKVTVVGAGYVGLVAAVCLSRSGHMVTCVESNEKKLANLNKGITPFYEESLQEYLEEALNMKRLRFAGNIKGAMDCNVLMVAVGTPARPDGRVDLSQIYDVFSEIRENIREPFVLLMKSTVPPGLGRVLGDRYLKSLNIPVFYVSNPEFLREGQAVHDWYNPDRIVVGGENIEAIDIVKGLYEDIDAPLCIMDICSAEMAKYAANALLATKISFINEIANLCELVGADVFHVSRAVGMDHRIGPHFLKAGLGYGGSCFPKDTSGLDFVSTFNGHNFNLLKAVIEVNARQRIQAIRKLGRSLGTLFEKRVAVLGLSFKPFTDDVREAPGLDIVHLLVDEGAKVSAYDPMAMNNTGHLLPGGVTLAEDAMTAIRGTHAVMLVTEWPEFSVLPWHSIRESMLAPRVILDGRNFLSKEEMTDLGFKYLGIGR